jgi:hypothetical protein
MRPSPIKIQVAFLLCIGVWKSAVQHWEQHWCLRPQFVNQVLVNRVAYNCLQIALPSPS